MKPDSYDIKEKIGVIFQDVAVFDESIFECVAVHTVEINNISYSYEKITYGQQK